MLVTLSESCAATCAITTGTVLTRESPRRAHEARSGTQLTASPSPLGDTDQPHRHRPLRVLRHDRLGGYIQLAFQLAAIKELLVYDPDDAAERMAGQWREGAA